MQSQVQVPASADTRNNMPNQNFLQKLNSLGGVFVKQKKPKWMEEWPEKFCAVTSRTTQFLKITLPLVVFPIENYCQTVVRKLLC